MVAFAQTCSDASCFLETTPSAPSAPLIHSPTKSKTQHHCRTHSSCFSTSRSQQLRFGSAKLLLIQVADTVQQGQSAKTIHQVWSSIAGRLDAARLRAAGGGGSQQG